MRSARLIPATDIQDWMNVLKRCNQYDVYHLPEFHHLMQTVYRCAPCMFVWEDGENVAALPMLLRDISCIDGLESCELFDAISVYGYAGPVTNMNPGSREHLRSKLDFQAALIETLSRQDIVSLLVRTHPLIDTSWLLDPVSEITSPGKVVVMDLSQSEPDQRSAMNARFRRDLKKARSAGIDVHEVEFESGIDDFMAVYDETMRRNSAKKSYYFSREYYRQLADTLNGSARMFVARRENEVMAAGIFLLNGSIIHYHLGGAYMGGLQCGAIKAILNHVRCWANDRGFRWFNLGGGVDSRNDSLLEFKRGFSKQQLDFKLAKIIVRPDDYRQLCSQRVPQSGKPVHYFPAYRRSTDEGDLVCDAKVGLPQPDRQRLDKLNCLFDSPPEQIEARHEFKPVAPNLTPDP